MASSKLNMLDLPNEILLKILDYTHSGDIKQLLLVCTKLYTIINDSHLMKRLTLCLTDITKPDGFECLKESDRKYKNLEIGFFDTRSKRFQQYKELFVKFGENIEKLKFFRTWLNITDYNNLLKCFPNVEYLDLCDINGDSEGAFPEDVGTFKKLKTVKSLECFPEMFKLLKNCQITKFNLTYCQDIFTDLTDAVDFLCSQKNLEHYSLEQVKDTNYFHRPLNTGSFSSIKSFKMVNCGFEMFEVENESFTNFLKNLSSLETIHLVENDFVLDDDYNIIFGECKNLKEATLDARYCTNINTVCHSVKRLHLTGNDEVTSISALLQKFPAVQYLSLTDLEELGRESFETIATALTDLNTLSIKYCKNEWLENIQICSLKTLILNCAGSLAIEGFRNITTSNPQIENLEVEWCNGIDDETLEIIVRNLQHLKTLKIRGNNELTSRAFDLIADNCPNLLELRMKIWTQKFTFEHMRPLLKLTALRFYAEDNISSSTIKLTISNSGRKSKKRMNLKSFCNLI